MMLNGKCTFDCGPGYYASSNKICLSIFYFVNLKKIVMNHVWNVILAHLVGAQNVVLENS